MNHWIGLYLTDNGKVDIITVPERYYDRDEAENYVKSILDDRYEFICIIGSMNYINIYWQ